MSEEIWSTLYSKIGRALRPSPIRELLKLTKRPGMISFAGGMPDPAIFPVKEFQEAAAILEEKGREILQYGATEGYAPLKEFLASWMAPRMGRVTKPEEMLITTGSQQVADLLGTVMLDPGDFVVVEEPTYPGTIHALRNHGAEFLPIPCDNEGMQVDLIPEHLAKARREGKRVKFIYSIVNFQNPSGATLSEPRRRKLLDIALQFGLPIFEDDPYGHLRYDGNHEPTVFSMDSHGVVLYACSFSKILAPGTRVAWATGPAELMAKMVMVKQGTDLCTSVVAQALVHEYCRLGHLDGFLPKILSHYKAKRDHMIQAFQQHLPGNAEYVVPQGGFFCWIRLPGVSSRQLFLKAVDRGVAFVVGDAFYPCGGGENSLRTCFTFASPDELQEGARRLALALQDLSHETR